MNENLERILEIEKQFASKNIKYLHFLKEYINNGCDRRKAYYTVYQNDNEYSAYSVSHTILKKPESQEYIKLMNSNIGECVGITKQSQLLRYNQIALDNNEKMCFRLKALERIDKLLGLENATSSISTHYVHDTPRFKDVDKIPNLSDEETQLILELARKSE